MENEAAVDPVTIVIKECINLSTAMRKYSQFTSQSGVAALLGGGSDIFSNQDDSLASTFNNLSTNKNNDPLLSGFIQLRLMLNKTRGLSDIDSLTLLQPFLLVIRTSSVSGYITSLALDSLQKFLTLNVINESSLNHRAAYHETVNALTHCRFEGSEQLSDDSVLLKVVILLQTIIQSPCGDLLSDSIMYDVLQTILSLACNKRRSEVLRRAAEFTMIAITVKIFNKLKHIEPTKLTEKYINDESYTNNELKDDMIGTSNKSNTVSNPEDGKQEELQSNSTETPSHPKPALTESRQYETLEVNYGLPVIKQYLNLLLSLIVPENQTKHTNSARIFGFNLINMAIEISGDKIPLHPRLFSLVSDPIFKYVLFIIQNSNKLSLLQAALQLFTTLVVILGDHLQMQVELTLTRIFAVLSQSSNKNVDDSKERSAAVKELLIEQISILWTRFASFFTSTFINFDCNLDRANLSIQSLTVLTRLALPEAAASTTDNVPPICLEGLVYLIDEMYERLQVVDREKFLSDEAGIDLLRQRERKTEFIKCAAKFNEKPKKGIPLLIEKGFIESDSEKDLAKFLFENNSRVNKKTIGLLLCDPKKVTLLKSFIDLFDFKGLRVDEAIRILLTKFRLPGESQQIERIIEAFSSRYVESQEYESSDITEKGVDDPTTVQPDADSVFILSYSIIMLNTDLHNPQVKEHMSYEDYSGNLKGCYNQKNFPAWYLDKIYCSIRDKEIVMPEEHHGNDRWFEDAWNNLISSTTVLTEVAKNPTNAIDSMSAQDLAQFDGAIFKTVGPSIVRTLFKIFKVASDDHISTRMLTSIDKCSYIASFFNYKGLFTDILRNIADMTTLLTPDSLSAKKPSPDVDEIPLVEIVMNDTKIAVSTESVRLGRSFKGQLCMVVFFRILRRNRHSAVIDQELWSKVMQIILVLFENLLIGPEVIPEIKQKPKFEGVMRPAPDITIKKAKETKGILSAFASYLKGDEEPTEDEIEASIKASQCIASSNIASSVFANEANVTTDLIKTSLSSIKLDKTTENSRFFESEMLFLVELSVALHFLYKPQEEVASIILEKISNLSQNAALSKATLGRLMAYRLLLFSAVSNKEAELLELINKDLLQKNEIFTQKFFASDTGSEVLNRILGMSEGGYYRVHLLQDAGFWKLLRSLPVMKGHAKDIYLFLERSLLKSTDTLTNKNFMWVLGLLDEISSAGALGSRWEIEYDKLVQRGQKVDSENPYQDVVELSLKSVNITSRLLEVDVTSFKLSKSETIAVIQALAHQCLNPCRQVRSYSLETLEVAIKEKIELPSEEIATVEEIIEGGLLPLLESTATKQDSNVPLSKILTVISNFYLHCLKKGIASNDTFLKVLNIFNKYVDMASVESQLQGLITEKKRIETSAAKAEDMPAEKILSETVDESTSAKSVESK